MSDKPVLQVLDLKLSFGGIRALDGVDLLVKPGEIVGLIGPNGSGKTSVLNIISGLYKADNGKILFDGKDITGFPPHKIASMGIGRSFQLAELFRLMTVLENLLLGCHTEMKSNLFSSGVFWGMAQKEEIAFRKRVEEVIDFMELARYRKHMVGSLSIGLQKLVGVARALCMHPRIMFLDEPSSGMNRQEKEDLARFVMRIKYELGIPVLWVEHDMKLIGDLTDRLVVLHCGRKIAEGTFGEVTTNPEVVRAFLGVQVC